MKKKMYSLLLMLVCVFALTACGEEQIINNWDTSMMMFTPERVIAFVMEPETLGFIVTEESVDEAKHHYRQVMDDESPQMLAMLAGWESYQGSIEEIGNPRLDETRPMYFKAGSDDGVIAVYHVLGDKHQATIELAYNSYSELESVTVNVQLALSEAMRNAGVNTLIGMGTVFVMLIVIMCIISILKPISLALAGCEGAILGLFSKKKAVKETETSVNNAIEKIIEREEAEEEPDDTELIAVITAAIAAATEASAVSGAEISTDGFVVRSIRRIR